MTRKTRLSVVGALVIFLVGSRVVLCSEDEQEDDEDEDPKPAVNLKIAVVVKPVTVRRTTFRPTTIYGRKYVALRVPPTSEALTAPPYRPPIPAIFPSQQTSENNQTNVPRYKCPGMELCSIEKFENPMNFPQFQAIREKYGGLITWPKINKPFIYVKDENVAMKAMQTCCEAGMWPLSFDGENNAYIDYFAGLLRNTYGGQNIWTAGYQANNQEPFQYCSIQRSQPVHWGRGEPRIKSYFSNDNCVALNSLELTLKVEHCWRRLPIVCTAHVANVSNIEIEQQALRRSMSTAKDPLQFCNTLNVQSPPDTLNDIHNFGKVVDIENQKRFMFSRWAMTESGAREMCCRFNMKLSALMEKSEIAFVFGYVAGFQNYLNHDFKSWRFWVTRPFVKDSGFKMTNEFSQSLKYYNIKTKGPYSICTHLEIETYRRFEFFYENCSALNYFICEAENRKS